VEKIDTRAKLLVTMKKWNLLVTGNDGRKFYQNFHVIEMDAEAAKRYLLENFPNAKLKPTIQIQEIEEMEDAELFLPGVVYRSGKAYFNQ
jgi:spore cortex formation protein SpoVR/YcgB (stage V sporulation)